MGNSNGLAWALTEFGLMIFEFLVIGEIVFSDGPRNSMNLLDIPTIGLYYYVLLVTSALQLIGILLVMRKHYRIGGIVQIVASAPHVIKLDGIFGIIGGLQAYRYVEQEVVNPA